MKKRKLKAMIARQETQMKSLHDIIDTQRNIIAKRALEYNESRAQYIATLKERQSIKELLMSALQPFARARDSIPNDTSDDVPLEAHPARSLTVGHLSDARDALARAKGQT